MSGESRTYGNPDLTQVGGWRVSRWCFLNL